MTRTYSQYSRSLRRIKMVKAIKMQILIRIAAMLEETSTIEDARRKMAWVITEADENRDDLTN